MRRAAARRQGRRRNLILHNIQGATRAPYPGFIEPCLATLHNAVPKRGLWIHEIKHDGYRAQAHLSKGKASIYTRRGYDWSDRFASIAETLRQIGDRDLILDGEVVVTDGRGISNFHSLQTDLAQGRTDRLIYFAFDILYLDGFDLRDVTLIHRKEVLTDLLADTSKSARIQLSGHIDADATAVFKQACAMQVEGRLQRSAIKV
jgi:bifunctional non-homologous end joining protein LigD